MIRWFLSLLHEHSPILIMLSVVFALGLFLVWALVLSRVEWFAESNDCSVDAVPMSPELLNVVQDPSTLTVTAEVRDNSDNEQWFALERTLITRFIEGRRGNLVNLRPDSGDRVALLAMT